MVTISEMRPLSGLRRIINEIRRHIIKDECDSPLLPFVHHAVGFLIIEFVGFSDLQLIGPTVYHKAHPGVGDYGNVDTVTVVK